MQLRFSKYFTFRESNSSNSRHCMIPMLSALSAFYIVYVTGTAVTPRTPINAPAFRAVSYHSRTLPNSTFSTSHIWKDYKHFFRAL